MGNGENPLHHNLVSFLIRAVQPMTAWLFLVERMDREVSRRFYKSKAWQKCRESYIASVGGLCERCLAEGIIKPGYIVHHKCYINASNINNPEVTLNWDNLEYLCQAHHNAIHFKENTKPRYKINGDGSVSIAPMSDK